MSFNESQHPRVPAGSPKGGEFASKGGSGSSDPLDSLYNMKFAPVGVRTNRRTLAPEEIPEGRAAYDDSEVDLDVDEEEAIRTWSEGDDEGIRERPYSAEGKNFRSGLEKIPPHTGIVYRGMDERARTKFANVSPGDHLVMDKLRSWSRSENVAMDFTNPDAQNSDTQAGVLLKIRVNRSPNFKDITPFMIKEHQYGKEVVSVEATTFRVVSVQMNVKHEYTVENPFMEDAGRPRTRLVHIVELEEVS